MLTRLFFDALKNPKVVFTATVAIQTAITYATQDQKQHNHFFKPKNTNNQPQPNEPTASTRASPSKP
jgi:hypothetical protein